MSHVSAFSVMMVGSEFGGSQESGLEMIWCFVGSRVVVDLFMCGERFGMVGDPDSRSCVRLSTAKFTAKCYSPENLRQLVNIVTEEWELLPQESIDNLIDSMRRRVGAVIVAGGGSTRY